MFGQSRDITPMIRVDGPCVVIIDGTANGLDSRESTEFCDRDRSHRSNTLRYTRSNRSKGAELSLNAVAGAQAMLASLNEFGLIVSTTCLRAVRLHLAVSDRTHAHNIAIGGIRYSGNYNIDETVSVDIWDSNVNVIGYFYARLTKLAGSSQVCRYTWK